MFPRLVAKAVTHRLNRLAVAAVALIVGSTITTAMLSVYYDAGRKMNRELRAYGANIMVGPRDGALLDQSAVDGLASGGWPAEIVAAAPFLYVVAQAGRNPETLPATSFTSPSLQRGLFRRPVVVAGTWLDQARKASQWWQVKGRWIEDRENVTDCLVGAHLASQLALNQNDRLEIVYGDLESGDNTAAEGSVPVPGPSDLRLPRSGPLATPASLRVRPPDPKERKLAATGSRTFIVAGLLDTGGPEDDQVIVTLRAAQQLSGLDGKLSAVAVSASGNPAQVESLASSIDSRVSSVRADLVRQIAQSEGRILSSLRLTMLLVSLFILTAASLSVATTLTALVMDRRKEIGTMKAIGADTSDLLRLFLVELAGLGLAGGIIGYLLGMIVAQPIGRSLFNSSVTPRLAVLVIILSISLAVAMCSGILPVRRIREVEPAVILKGD